MDIQHSTFNVDYSALSVRRSPPSLIPTDYFQPKSSSHLMARVFLLLTLALTSLAPAQEVSFNREIRPILSNKCFFCHGPDENKREAGLRLDTPEGAYALKDGIQAFKPSSLADSEAWSRITDTDDPMPPDDGHAKPLSSA